MNKEKLSINIEKKLNKQAEINAKLIIYKSTRLKMVLKW